MFFIPGCPNTYVGELSEAINLADLFYKGLPPIAGGTLDQSSWFLRFADCLASEDAQAKSELYK
jgi:hypothetical protein